jgi:hypothetical protein
VRGEASDGCSTLLPGSYPLGVAWCVWCGVKLSGLACCHGVRLAKPLTHRLFTFSLFAFLRPSSN